MASPYRRPSQARHHSRAALGTAEGSAEADDFSEVHRVRRETDVTATSSYFRFDPEEHESTAQFRKRLRRTLEHARRESGKIDAIIFPELALTETQYYEAERVAFDERAILIAGLREKRTGLYDWDLNWCAVQPAGMLRETNDRYRRNDRLIESLRLRQPKHHRWRLTHEQIISYQLSGRLPVQSDCWENAELLPRIMHFVTLNHMTWSVLICEDFACATRPGRGPDSGGRAKPPHRRYNVASGSSPSCVAA